MSKIKIIIADDHPVFADGLKSLLADEETVEVVGVAHNGQELIELVKTIKVDVVISDINMPIMDGVESTIHIKKNFPNVKVLAFTMHSEYKYIEKMLKAGASGYILKNAARDEFTTAIYKIFRGENYISSEATSIMMSKFAGTSVPSRSFNGSESDVHITQRELEVIKYIVKGFTSTQIAEKLFISIRTVETHRKNVLQKLKLHNSASLVKYAIDNGLVPENEMEEE